MSKTKNPPYEYRADCRKKILFILSGIVICAVSFLTEIMLGASGYGFSEVFSVILHPGAAEKAARVIIWQIRLPVAVMAAAVGGTLGIAGATMQTILGNPLASPYTLGLSAGAGFGAALAMVAGLSSIAVISGLIVPAMAFIFALLACMGIYMISKLKRFTSEIMILAGIGMVFFFQAGQSFLQYTASDDALAGIVFWTFGSLTRNVSWINAVIVMIVCALAFLYIYKNA